MSIDISHDKAQYVVKCRGAEENRQLFMFSKENERNVPHDDYLGQMETLNHKTLITLVQRKIGVEVSYSTTLRRKHKAVWVLAYTSIRGNVFQLLTMNTRVTKNTRVTMNTKVTRNNNLMFISYVV